MTNILKTQYNRPLLWLGCLLSLCTSIAHAFSWQDLWHNKDHVAQKMMRKGLYAEAQKKFKRQDWRAVAAYRARNYKQASAFFSALNQADGYYNAGNAYAHMGRYEDAIQAYDKALTLNKQDQDTLDNRHIVEELLKKQRHQDKQAQNKQGQDRQGQDRQGQDRQGQDRQGQDRQGQDRQGQDRQGQDRQGQDKQGQDKQGQDKQGQDKHGQDKQGQDKHEQDKQGQDKHEQDRQGQNKQEQDRQGQNKQEQNKQGQQKPGQQSTPDTSKQALEKQTTDQWLNMIPDDPGGLLREKFLRDYLRRRGES